MVDDLSGQFARRIEILLGNRDFERAHAIIDQYAVASQPQAELSLDQKRELPVSDVFELRIANSLEGLGIFSVGALLATKPERLLASDSFGETSLAQIRSTLTEMGFVNAGAIQNIVTPPPRERRRR